MCGTFWFIRAHQLTFISSLSLNDSAAFSLHSLLCVKRLLWTLPQFPQRCNEAIRTGARATRCHCRAFNVAELCNVLWHWLYLSRCNQCHVVTDPLHAVMKHFSPDASGRLTSNFGKYMYEGQITGTRRTLVHAFVRSTGREDQRAGSSAQRAAHSADGVVHGVVLHAVLDALRGYGPDGHLW